MSSELGRTQAGAAASTAVQPTAAQSATVATVSRTGTAAQPTEVAQQTAAPLTPSVGTGELSQPAGGPSPLEAAKLKGAPYVLVKNWDFGAQGTIRNLAELRAEFEFHDLWGTIANGTNYGAVTVAPSEDTAIAAPGLRLSDDRQPVEDPSAPYRQWTSDSLITYVRPLDPELKKVKAKKHNVGNGSFMAKWKLPRGGALLGHDLVWETRVRMPKYVPGYWFALWTAGSVWNNGAEMDVVESFGAPNTPGDAFHTATVGGVDDVDYTSWPDALDEVGVPEAQRKLSDYHVWTWVYLRDDSYEVYYDGHQVQSGELHWTAGGTEGGAPIDMYFLFDFSWGHTQVDSVDIELPAEQLPFTYEIDYSRVYMR
jgi:hypothetical protein